MFTLSATVGGLALWALVASFVAWWSCSTLSPVSTWMGDRLRAGIGLPPRYVTKPTRSTQPDIPPEFLNRIPALTGLSKGLQECQPSALCRVWENVCNNSKKRKVMFLDFGINVKTKKSNKRTGYLITQLYSYQKSVGLSVSHQHQTSCFEMWTQENATSKVWERRLEEKRVYIAECDGPKV